MEGGKDLLVLVVDTNPTSWTSKDDVKNEPIGFHFQSIVQQLLIFINAYLLLHRANQIVVIASHHDTSDFLYPSAVDPANDPEDDPHDAAMERKFSAQALIQKLNHLFQTGSSSLSSSHGSEATTTAMSAALSRALCYIHQCKRRNRLQNKDRSRIFVLQQSRDASSQYIPIMNCIFSAQKNNIMLDACVLSDQDSSFMQQAALLTQGMYLHLPQHVNILQTLFLILLPNADMRSVLKLPSQSTTTVDFRASCFCCQKSVSTAFICPVCLSIFCTFSSSCSTCGIQSPPNHSYE